ncbi:hypothetical protein QCD70_12735 [Agreia sp. PsM10]|uniref:hypothetical protein n=1 Tax=Agreia sp. PsM10 TaxID=3030533 RepID=UPI00263B70B6|nr:hypothetical protein [Agreia sp. PsM10]MDN4641117.1 hypothetical protein [Agreia sp. PsM10]
MTRVSNLFSLGVTQGGLDFVDVDVDEDAPVFIDPSAIRSQTGDWVESCYESLQSFFSELLAAIRGQDQGRIGELVFPLVEPNETHLGLSAGKSRGSGLGNKKKAAQLVRSLARSKAAQSGFLKDLEDTALFVPGVDKDIVSDITTSVIRNQLIEYTQRMCLFYGIPMDVQVSGPFWDASDKKWKEDNVALPRGGMDKLLLVPKSIVRVKLTVDKGKYYRGYLRPYFEALEVADPKSNLVRLLRDKRRKVVKGELDKKLGTTKADIIKNTQVFPVALDDYRRAIDSAENASLADQDLSARTGTPPVDVVEMLEELKSILPGRGGATPYHRAVAKILTALFDTYLGNCRLEEDLHGGLKRLDIVFDNIAANGFFDWVRKNFSAAYIVVECKNYGEKEPANPEFDQIAMRLSPTRGQIGILTVRSLADKQRAMSRAKTISGDQHGFVLVLDDDDIAELVDEYVAHFANFEEEPRPLAVLRRRFDELVGMN